MAKKTNRTTKIVWILKVSSKQKSGWASFIPYDEDSMFPGPTIVDDIFKATRFSSRAYLLRSDIFSRFSQGDYRLEIKKMKFVQSMKEVEVAESDITDWYTSRYLSK